MFAVESAGRIKRRLIPPGGRDTKAIEMTGRETDDIRPDRH